MGYQVLHSVIYKYNYPPHKNSGLKLNINKINTQINMKNQSGKPRTDQLFITKVKYCLLFHFYPFLYSYLLFMYLLIF